MEEIVSRFFTNLLERPSSPRKMPFLLQPAVAIDFGVRAGMSEAKLRRKPYFRTVVLEKEERPELIGEGWKDIGMLVIMAWVLDTAYQLIALNWRYPLETLVIATVLAVLPYVAIRGLVGRVFSMKDETSHT